MFQKPLNIIEKVICNPVSASCQLELVFHQSIETFGDMVYLFLDLVIYWYSEGTNP